jgi:hypothetical protein
VEHLAGDDGGVLGQPVHDLALVVAADEKRLDARRDLA